MSEDSTDHQKFNISIISYESFFNRFLDGSINLFNKMKEKKDVFQKITKFKNDELDNFIQKISATRNYYVHGGPNKIHKKKIVIYSNSIELIGLSFLFSSVVAYLLLELQLKELKEELLEIYIQKSNEKFREFQFHLRKELI